MANDTYPNKPLQPWIPKSQRNSGTQLDEGCGEIEQASHSATMSMDEVFQSLGTEKGEITMPRIEVNASHTTIGLRIFSLPGRRAKAIIFGIYRSGHLAAKLSIV